MWILQFLPDWIFNVILAIGVLGLGVTYFLKFIPIPMIYMYKTPIQLASVVLIVIATFMSGVVYNQNIWLERVAELEKQVEVGKAKSEKVNVEVVTKYVTKTQVIKEKGDEVVKYVDREVIKIDERCTLSEEAIKAHNQAAKERK
jgi:hypothetical protein